MTTSSTDSEFTDAVEATTEVLLNNATAIAMTALDASGAVSRHLDVLALRANFPNVTHAQARFDEASELTGVSITTEAGTQAWEHPESNAAAIDAFAGGEDFLEFAADFDADPSEGENEADVATVTSSPGSVEAALAQMGEYAASILEALSEYAIPAVATLLGRERFEKLSGLLPHDAMLFFCEDLQGDEGYRLAGYVPEGGDGIVELDRGVRQAYRLADSSDDYPILDAFNGFVPLGMLGLLDPRGLPGF